jgi:hypothetical protein
MQLLKSDVTRRQTGKIFVKREGIEERNKTKYETKEGRE